VLPFTGGSTTELSATEAWIGGAADDGGKPNPLIILVSVGKRTEGAWLKIKSGDRADKTSH
jgi:hypothetical protein